jgi:SAM-dependent methyltransferase
VKDALSHPEDRSYGKTAHLYELFDKKNNISFFCHYASPVGEALDVGAGTGRIAIPLAEKGITVCCVEPSLAMRREFARKLRERPELRDYVQLIAGEARSFEVPRRFPMAFLSGAFDHFLDNEERLGSLVNIGRHLVENGVLVFDVSLSQIEDRPLSAAGVAQLGRVEVQRFVGGRVLKDGTKEIILVFELRERGQLVKRIEERGVIGITSREEVHSILKEAGFQVKQEFGDYQLRPYRQGDTLLVIEASRGS